MPLANPFVDHYGRRFYTKDIINKDNIGLVESKFLEEFSADDIRREVVLVGNKLYLLSDLKQILKQNHYARLIDPYTREDLTESLPQFKAMIYAYENHGAHYNAGILEIYPEFIDLFKIYVEEMLHPEDGRRDKNAPKSQIRANFSQRLNEFYSTIAQFPEDKAEAFRSLFLNNREYLHVQTANFYIFPTKWSRTLSNARLYDFAIRGQHYHPYPFRNVIIKGAFDNPEDACMHSWGVDVLYLLLEYHIGTNKPFKLFDESNESALIIENMLRARIMQSMSLLNPRLGLKLRQDLEDFVNETIDPDSLKLVSHLRENCINYMSYLLKQLNQDMTGDFPMPNTLDGEACPKILAKYDAVFEMYSTLNNQPLSQGLSNFKALFAEQDRQDLIMNHRDGCGLRFLNIIASLLSLGIKNLLTGYQNSGQYFGFWTSRGGCFMKEVQSLLKEQKTDVMIELQSLK